MRKTYEKPKVAEVKLAAEEAVLTNCKAFAPDPAIPDGCQISPTGPIVLQTIGS